VIVAQALRLLAFGNRSAFALLRRDKCGCPTLKERAQSLRERISIWLRFVHVIRV